MIPSADYLRGAADERDKIRLEIARLLAGASDAMSLANAVNLLREWLEEHGRIGEDAVERVA